MSKGNRLRIFLICTLIITLFVIYIPVLATQFYHEWSDAPKAADGAMHMTTGYQENKKIYLDGQWVFYWKQLLITEPGLPNHPYLILEVPDKWSRYKVDGEYLPAGGYGSYRLIITGLTNKESVTIDIPDFDGAYRIYLDGKLTAETGTISKNSQGVYTNPTIAHYPVTLSGKTEHEVIIEVATSRFAGLYKTPVLSDYHQTVLEEAIRTDARLILFGIAVFSFISLLTTTAAMFHLKFHSFWMPVMLFFILLRIMLTSEFYGFWQPLLFFNIPYESMHEMMYFTTFVMKYLLIFLIQEQCGIHISKMEKLGFLGLYLILFLIFLITPDQIYGNYLSNIIPALTYALDIFLFVKIYRARSEMKKFGMIVFLSSVLVTVGLSVDSYYLSGVIYMNMSMALLICLSLFLLIMNGVYTLRVRGLYGDYIQSSMQLEFANKMTAVQKHYYAAVNEQMAEVREIKHDFRHIIGVMSRLTEEKQYDELNAFLNEYSQKTNMEQLSVFCENIIANSIIGFYYIKAKEKGIYFESLCSIDSQNTVNDSDLCIILGNALENAFDACCQMQAGDNPFISISMHTVNNQQLLKVKNSYRGALKTSDGRLSSSKQGKSHGLGLQNIERIVSSYGGFIKIEYNESAFILMSAIPEKGI
ncbi:MAG: ATP-binding protein [Eubacteriales bacterium]